MMFQENFNNQVPEHQDFGDHSEQIIGQLDGIEGAKQNLKFETARKIITQYLEAEDPSKFMCENARLVFWVNFDEMIKEPFAAKMLLALINNPHDRWESDWREVIERYDVISEYVDPVMIGHAVLDVVAPRDDYGWSSRDDRILDCLEVFKDQELIDRVMVAIITKRNSRFFLLRGSELAVSKMPKRFIKETIEGNRERGSYGVILLMLKHSDDEEYNKELIKEAAKKAPKEFLEEIDSVENMPNIEEYIDLAHHAILHEDPLSYYDAFVGPLYGYSYGRYRYGEKIKKILKKYKYVLEDNDELYGLLSRVREQGGRTDEYKRFLRGKPFRKEFEDFQIEDDIENDPLGAIYRIQRSGRGPAEKRRLIQKARESLLRKIKSEEFTAYTLHKAIWIYEELGDEASPYIFQAEKRKFEATKEKSQLPYDIPIHFFERFGTYAMEEGAPEFFVAVFLKWKRYFIDEVLNGSRFRNQGNAEHIVQTMWKDVPELIINEVLYPIAMAFANCEPDPDDPFASMFPGVKMGSGRDFEGFFPFIANRPFVMEFMEKYMPYDIYKIMKGLDILKLDESRAEIVEMVLKFVLEEEPWLLMEYYSLYSDLPFAFTYLEEALPDVVDKEPVVFLRNAHFVENIDIEGGIVDLDDPDLDERSLLITPYMQLAAFNAATIQPIAFLRDTSSLRGKPYREQMIRIAHIRTKVAAKLLRKDLPEGVGAEIDDDGGLLAALLMSRYDHLRKDSRALLEDPGLRHIHLVPLDLIEEVGGELCEGDCESYAAMISRNNYLKNPDKWDLVTVRGNDYSREEVESGVTEIREKREELREVDIFKGRRVVFIANNEVFEDGSTRFGTQEQYDAIEAQDSASLTKIRPVESTIESVQEAKRETLRKMRVTNSPATFVFDGHGDKAMISLVSNNDLERLVEESGVEKREEAEQFIEGLSITSDDVADTVIYRLKHNDLGPEAVRQDIYIFSACKNHTFAREVIEKIRKKCEAEGIAPAYPILMGESEYGQNSLTDTREKMSSEYFDDVIEMDGEGSTLGTSFEREGVSFNNPFCYVDGGGYPIQIQ